MIPVVDLFAGPGGLSEGFCSVEDDGERAFKVVLSVESQAEAFRTLRLRAFFRGFAPGKAPDEYYCFVKGRIDEETLYRSWPEQAEQARAQTWQSTLGVCDHDEVDARVTQAVSGAKVWVLIGGPPCQAYSSAGVVGNRTKKNYNAEEDSRYRLYREFIRVLAAHSPAAFVLENVPGMLSARLGDRRIIEDLLHGLAVPGDFALREFGAWPEGRRYRLLALTSGLRGPGADPRGFIVRAEDFGVPQCRHRVIIIGLRDDLDPSRFLPPAKVETCSAALVLDDLPAIRSTLSRAHDSLAAWREVFSGLEDQPWLKQALELHGVELHRRLLECSEEIAVGSPQDTGAEFIPASSAPTWQRVWFSDPRLPGILHHQSRPHMRSDLHRYLFCSCFAAVRQRSPKLPDFPGALLPDHSNSTSGSFKDRFRVLLRDRPAGTVISHLAKDGHAFIHPNPLQCRSLTPREAARLQTFPDNYYFFGSGTGAGRASRFRQIGNAVPPLLARVVAESLMRLLRP